MGREEQVSLEHVCRAGWHGASSKPALRKKSGGKQNCFLLSEALAISIPGEIVNS